MAFRFPHPIQPQPPRRLPSGDALRQIGRTLANLDEGLITRSAALEDIRRAYLETVR